MPTHDLIVIGAGAAGLTAAGGGAMLGLKVALIERGAMGGDCLNTGCVPSKALIAAAARAEAFRSSASYGIASAEPEIDFASVHAHVHAAIATIAPIDSQERFEALGVEVIRGAARFTARDTISVDGRALSAPRIVIAAGSRPAIPDIAGLNETPHLTNETLFDLAELPRHLLILGGGPIGVEMAQAFRRLGAAVTLVTKATILPRDDPDAVAIVRTALADEGVEIVEHADADRVAAVDGAVTLHAGDRAWRGSHLLVATGRTFDGAGLDLATAGVDYDATGIIVDARRRTSNRRILAIGDCRQGPRFTHVSGAEGALAVQAIGFGLPAKVDFRALPRVTYADPELTQIGLTEAEAREQHGDRVRIQREDFSHNDRAIAEGDARGVVKAVFVGRKPVGVTIVGAHAGELALPWIMAITGKSSAFGMAGLTLPYPTRSEATKAVFFARQDAWLFNRTTCGWARLLARLRR